MESNNNLQNMMNVKTTIEQEINTNNEATEEISTSTHNINNNANNNNFNSITNNSIINNNTITNKANSLEINQENSHKALKVLGKKIKRYEKNYEKQENRIFEPDEENKKNKKSNEKSNEKSKEEKGLKNSKKDLEIEIINKGTSSEDSLKYNKNVEKIKKVYDLIKSEYSPLIQKILNYTALYNENSSDENTEFGRLNIALDYFSKIDEELWGFEKGQENLIDQKLLNKEELTQKDLESIESKRNHFKKVKEEYYNNLIEQDREFYEEISTKETFKKLCDIYKKIEMYIPKQVRNKDENKKFEEDLFSAMRLVFIGYVKFQQLNFFLNTYEPFDYNYHFQHIIDLFRKIFKIEKSFKIGNMDMSNINEKALNELINTTKLIYKKNIEELEKLIKKKENSLDEEKINNYKKNIEKLKKNIENLDSLVLDKDELLLLGVLGHRTDGKLNYLKENMKNIIGMQNSKDEASKKDLIDDILYREYLKNK